MRRLPCHPGSSLRRQGHIVISMICQDAPAAIPLACSAIPHVPLVGPRLPHPKCDQTSLPTARLRQKHGHGFHAHVVGGHVLRLNWAAVRGAPLGLEHLSKETNEWVSLLFRLGL